MKDQLILEIQRRMLPHLNNEQLLHLGNVLQQCLQCVEITDATEIFHPSDTSSVDAFISANRIEG